MVVGEAGGELSIMPEWALLGEIAAEIHVLVHVCNEEVTHCLAFVLCSRRARTIRDGLACTGRARC